MAQPTMQPAAPADDEQGEMTPDNEQAEGEQSGDYEIDVIFRKDGSIEVCDPEPCEPDDQGTPCKSIGDALKMVLQHAKELQAAQGGEQASFEQGFAGARGQ